MNSFTQNWRLTISVLIALTLIVGAYIAATSGALKPSRVAASTETALLNAIATKDTDGDGLADWEEFLYGTDQNKVDSKGLGMTDGEAVAKGLIVPTAVADVPQAPGGSGAPTMVDGVPAPAPDSLTAKFAQNFFLLYLDAKQAKNGQPLSEEDTSALAQTAVTQMMESVAPISDFKTASDLKISRGGSENLRTFAATAEAVFAANPNDATKSELLYLQDLVQNDDTTATAHIAALAKTYHQTAQGLSVLPVPPELAADYLVLINALERIGKIASDFARVEADPLATILALTQYPESVIALGTAFVHIYEIYAKKGISMAPGSPGASFVNLIPQISVEQEVEAKTAQP